MKQSSELTDVLAIGLAREHLVKRLAGGNARADFVRIHVVFEDHPHLTHARYA